MAEIRDILSELRTDVTDERGLEHVLESALARVGARTAAAVRLHADGDGARPPLPKEQGLWRIAREAIANAERHAGASAITVRWHVDGDRAVLEVDDDGRGFDAGAGTEAGSGRGLARMREQAAAIGASVEVRSQPSCGTRVCCEVRLP